VDERDDDDNKKQQGGGGGAVDKLKAAVAAVDATAITNAYQGMMNCGEKMLDGIAIDGDTLYDASNNSIVDFDNNINNIIDKNTVKEEVEDGDMSAMEWDDDQTQMRQQGINRFTCGVDPEDLRLNTKTIKNEMVQEVKAVGRDVKYGIRTSLRNIFGVCDITNTGGVDVLTKNVDLTNDQLFGRVPLPKTKNRTHSTVKSSVATPPPPPEGDTAPAVAANTPLQAAKTTSEKYAQKLKEMSMKHVEDVDANRNQEIFEKEEKQKKMSPTQRKRLYLEKLKAVSLKHL
jgi:hypothetical protein